MLAFGSRRRLERRLCSRIGCPRRTPLWSSPHFFESLWRLGAGLILRGSSRWPDGLALFSPGGMDENCRSAHVVRCTRPERDSQMSQGDPRTINARPTKELFISMLVKDIELIRAIADLVDNSIDGARRLRGPGPYNGLWVRVEVSPERFRIADNCGGIPIDIAREYAFRFGRPEGTPATPHSVGQFGVGMKRALFKLGRAFRVESRSETARFVVEEDVEKWKERPDDWTFRFKESQEDLSPASEDQWGTTVSVDPLHDAVADEFGLENFRSRLIEELSAAQQLSLEGGLAISLNLIPLQFRPLELLHSDELRPASRDLTFNDATPLRVKLYAGVAPSDPTSAGWYVFCNSRLVLRADQTLATGWGENRETTIPKYHNQFARFRGYAFFDCDDAARLPWNTTKTGVDLDSPIYRSVRLTMLTMMRPVIDF